LGKFVLDFADSRSSLVSFGGFRRLFSKFGEYSEDDLRLMFSFLNLNIGNEIDLADLVCSLYSTVTRFDGLEVYDIFNRRGLKRGADVSKIRKALLKYEDKSSGFISTKDLDRSLRLVLVSLTTDDLFCIKDFFDPFTSGTVDAIFVSSFAGLICNVDHCSAKLRHYLKQLEEKGWFKQLFDKEKKINAHDLAKLFRNFGIPCQTAEILIAVSQVSSNGVVDVAKYLEASIGVEKDPKNTNSLSFGRGLYKKLCKLRSSLDSKTIFRKYVLSKDDGKNGCISAAGFKVGVQKTTECSNEEMALLCECFAVISQPDSIFYIFLLLWLAEPLHTSVDSPIFTAVSSKIKRLSSSEVSEFTSRILRKLRNLDIHNAGFATIAALTDCFEKEDIIYDAAGSKSFIQVFLDGTTGQIAYPEMIAFFLAHSLSFVGSRLNFSFDIRKKQGYDVRDDLARLYKTHKNSVDVGHIQTRFVDLGLIFPETMVRFLSANCVSPETNNFSLERFADVAQTDEDSSPLEISRVVETTSSIREPNKICNISMNILTEYDGIMLKSLQRAFDLFDKKNTNEIPSDDLERVLCSVGLTPSVEDLQSLLLKLDPKDFGTIEFNSFMKQVVPYVRKTYGVAGEVALSKLHQQFVKFDASGDGLLQKQELAHLLRSSTTHIDVEELNSILVFLDVDEDGCISWEEFRRVYDIIKDNEEMMSLAEPLRSALRKLQYSALPNPVAYLNLFHGLPFNYRLSVLSEVEKYVPEISLHKRMCSPDFSYLKNVGPRRCQFELSFTKLSGVPSEAEFRAHDVVGRALKVAVCKTTKAPEAGDPGAKPIFLSNVQHVHAFVHDTYGDKWIFKQKDSDESHNLFFNCSFPEEVFHQIYVFVEVITTFRLKPVENDGGTSGGTLNQESFNSAPQTFDMCCGWSLLPLSEITVNKTLQLKMVGGTPFSSVEIKREDVKLRDGTWQRIKRLLGFQVKSVLEMKIAPLAQILPGSKSTQGVQSLKGINATASLSLTGTDSNSTVLDNIPSNTILPSGAVVMMAIYRMMMLKALRLFDAHPDRLLPQTGALHQPDFVVGCFPKLLADKAASRVLMMHWLKEFPSVQLSTIGAKAMGSLDDRCIETFRTVVMRLWHAFNSIDASFLPTDVGLHTQMKETLLQQIMNTYFTNNPASKAAQAELDGFIVQTPFNCNELLWTGRIIHL
jgi:Ca2+-binding EF-hand superfamily protein